MAAPGGQGEPLGATFAQFTGPIFVGSVLSWGLFGVLSMQMYTYLSSDRSKDTIWIRLTVWATYSIALLQLITGTRWVWKTLVAHWGETIVFTSTVVFEDAADILSIPLTDGALSGIVELFLAWRIWALSKSLWARISVVLIVIVSLISSISAWYIGIRLLINGGTAAELGKTSAEITVWSVCLFISDLLIATTLTIILVGRRNTSNAMRQTEKLIDRIILITVETGMITALIGPIHLGLYYGLPANYIHITSDMLVGKLYANVLLVTLNSRGAHKSPSGAYNNGSRSGGSDFVSLSGARRAIVNVETETYKNNTTGDYAINSDIEMKRPHVLNKDSEV